VTLKGSNVLNEMAFSIFGREQMQTYAASPTCFHIGVNWVSMLVFTLLSQEKGQLFGPRG
jgi:hypothetical protein